MTKVQTASYGTWKSPLTTNKMVEKSVEIGGLTVDSNGQIYFSELRPNDNGRTVLCEFTDHGPKDITPTPFNVSTRVHEYGGSALAINGNTCYFSNFSDQRIYKQILGKSQTPATEVTPITPERPWRFANFALAQKQPTLYAVMEDHTKSDINAENTIAIINTQTGEVNALISGHDFYSAVSLSNDEKYLSYICWDHPNMPWDGNELWIAELSNDNQIINQQKIAGGISQSIFQPTWSADGALYFVDDKTGWWNLYQYKNGKITSLCNMEAEFGRPQWRFGDITFQLINNDEILCTYRDTEKWNIAKLDIQTKKLTKYDTAYTSFKSLNVHSGSAWFVGASPTKMAAIVKMDLSTGKTEEIYIPSSSPITKDYISEPVAIEFPTANNKTAHAYFYPPHNPEYTAPTNELPPLIVMSHGGPTGNVEHILSARHAAPTQYWTTRGFAVLDVNYGGSSGYGREYRNRLRLNWGIVDTQDCENAALYLISKNLVDKNRIAIRGGSAGGYCTLCALTFTNTFKAGASYFGVSDLVALAQDTHKFESRYLDSMIGPYPEEKQKYFDRAPINFTEKLSCPVIFFQGLKDRVVPPNQAEGMYNILLKKGLPTAYVKYPEEQHGFKQAENIKHALETELSFYAKVFKFSVADKLPEVEFQNM